MSSSMFECFLASVWGTLWYHSFLCSSWFSEPRAPWNCLNPFLYWSEGGRLLLFVKESQHASYSQYLTVDIIHDEWDSLGVIFFFSGLVITVIIEWTLDCKGVPFVQIDRAKMCSALTNTSMTITCSLTQTHGLTNSTVTGDRVVSPSQQDSAGLKKRFIQTQQIMKWFDS